MNRQITVANYCYKTGPFLREKRPSKLLCLFTDLFTIAFARHSFLHAALFAGLKIEGVPLDFLNHVLLLDFSFEAAQGVFKRFCLL